MAEAGPADRRARPRRSASARPRAQVGGDADRDGRRVLARRAPGSPIGVVIRAIVGRVVPLVRELASEPAHFADEPIRPIEPRCSQRSAASHSAASSAWSWVMTSTWVPGGQLAEDQLGQHGTWCTCTRATASSRTAQPRRPRAAPARESTRCSSRSWRARIRASSSPTWPDPEDRDRGYDGQRLEQQGHLAAAALHAVLDGRLVGERHREQLGARRPASREQRAGPLDRGRLEVAAADAPQVVVGGDDHLRAASRGACPRTAATVTSTPGSTLARSRSTAASQFMAGSLRREQRCCQPRSDSGCIGRGVRVGLVGHGAGEALDARAVVVAARASLDRPVDRLRGRRRRAGRRWCPAGPNAAAAWRSASRTEKASISGGSPTALEP